MRTGLLIAGLALARAYVAPGSDLAIDSFQNNGRLTFQQVVAAASYRIEWATNLISPTWSSNAPGIAVIPPSGAGTLTVTVGVVHASCYYRVVAIVTNVPPAGLTNTFEINSENWLMVSYPFHSHAPNPATSSLPFDGTFGNPAGSVRAGDFYPETGIAAPVSYLGNKLSFYRGRILYEIYLRYTDNVLYPAVVLNGGSMSLYYDAPSPPLNAWQQREIPLSETGWKVSGSGTPATESIFKTVLSNLAGLYIYTEWHTGADDTSVDNISMTPP
jgi:hypothetical protein